MAGDLVDRLRARLDYDPETGAFKWRASPDMSKQWNTRYAGTPAFSSKGSLGYRLSAFEGEKFYGQSVAWMIHYGRPPEGRIRFLNGDRADLRIANLQEEVSLIAEERRRLYLRENRAQRVNVPVAQAMWLKAHTHISMRARYLAFLKAFPQERTFFSFKHLCQKLGIKYDRKVWSESLSKNLSAPIGSRRTSGRDYVVIRTENGWEYEHRVRWATANGPIPDGFYLMCKSDDTSNTDPANWMLADKATIREASVGKVLTVKDVPPQLRPAVIVLAQVTVASRKARQRPSAEANE